mgnify:CR=1 FL=1
MAQAPDPVRAPGSAAHHRSIEAVRAEIARVIVGQTDLVDRLLVQVVVDT